VFEQRPHLVDSVIQLFQAKAFAVGQVVLEAPEHYGFFMTQHMLVRDGLWSSQYPPGHSLLLAIGVLCGVPWVIPILLSLGTIVLVYTITRSIYDETTAGVAVILISISPFFLFLGASFMNHVSSLFFIALFLYCYLRWEESGLVKWSFTSGAAIGLAFMVRPYTAFAVGVVFAVYSLGRLRNGGKGVEYLAGVAGFLMGSAGYFFYNLASTGDPLIPGYSALWGEPHGIGFHLSPWGKMHTPFLGFRNQLVHLSQLHEYLFDTPIPGLFPIALYLLLAAKLQRWDKRLVLGFLSIPVAYFFYWHRDAFLGPRFMYESLVFLIPLTARALVYGFRLSAKWTFRVARPFRLVSGRVFLTALVLVCVSYVILFSAPLRYKSYTGMQSMRLNLVDQAGEQGISEALVFVKVSWGSRIIATLRELDMSASQVQRAYSAVDHCLLYQASRMGRAGLLERIDQLLLEKHNLQKILYTRDHTLKLDPDRPLAEECREEIEYDKKGGTIYLPHFADNAPDLSGDLVFTIYFPHFADNAPDLRGDLVFARDLRERNSELMRLYPDKPAYLYVNGEFILL